MFPLYITAIILSSSKSTVIYINVATHSFISFQQLFDMSCQQNKFRFKKFHRNIINQRDLLFFVSIGTMK